MIPVINHARLERLRPPETTAFPINANTICIFIIILGMIGLYKRYVDINQRKTPLYT